MDMQVTGDESSIRSGTLSKGVAHVEVPLAQGLARVAVEAGVPMGWEKYVGAFGTVVGIENRFGASAPLKVVLEKYGFTAANVAAKAVEVVEGLPARLAALGLRKA